MTQSAVPEPHSDSRQSYPRDEQVSSYLVLHIPFRGGKYYFPFKKTVDTNLVTVGRLSQLGVVSKR